MREDIAPFEYREIGGRPRLWLHGRMLKHKVVEEDKVQIIMDAIAEGYDIDIQYAIIDGNLDIRDIIGRLEKDDNDYSIINGKIAICISEIHGNVFFIYNIFNGYVNFRAVTFKDADFNSSIFNSYAMFNSVTFNSADFTGVTFNIADFGEATFIGNANFMSATFNDAYFMSATFNDRACFSSVKMELPGNFSDVRFIENTVWKGLWNITLGRIKHLYRAVTDFSEFNTTTVMDGSSNPYLKRYIDDEQWIQSWKERSWWRRRLFFIWELTSHCGRSFTLWMFWSLLFACIFGIIYSNYDYPSWLTWFPSNWRPEFYISAIDRIPTGFTYYYFSIVAFTTLGFGDITPMNLAGEIWLAIEVILGYIMLGGLLSIFASKFARRS